MGELGFEALRRGKSNVLGDGPNLYAFVRNNPVNSLDKFGLAYWVCTRVNDSTYTTACGLTRKCAYSCDYHGFGGWFVLDRLIYRYFEEPDPRANQPCKDSFSVEGCSAPKQKLPPRGNCG